MTLEDYRDATDFLAAGSPPPADRWVEEFRRARAAASFEGVM